MEFILNGEKKQVALADANLTLLDYLRLQQKLTGTKEGCASGDCGACSVLVREAGQPLRAINACITLMANINRREVFTVEALAAAQSLHPVQQAMVDCHGSQCGFCTPGFVMSLAGLYHNSLDREQSAISRDSVCDAISGNLCRCTGYRPIIEAGTSMLHYPAASLVKSAPESNFAEAEELLTSDANSCLIFPRFNGHQNLTDEVSNAKIYKPQKDLGVFN